MDDPEVQKVHESTGKSTVDDSEVQKKVHNQELELIKIKAHFEGLQRLIEEKERLIEEKDERIKDLTREVTTLNGFAHYFKTAEVKQIEAPAAERTKPWWKFW